MGLIPQLEVRNAFPVSNVSNPADWLIDALGGGPSRSGIQLTPETALSAPAVMSAISGKARHIAMMPIHIYRRGGAEGRERHRDPRHHLAQLLRYQPNPEMTAFEFKSWMQANLMMFGSGVAVKDLDTAGRVTALWPMRADRVTAERDKTSKLFYHITHNGQRFTFPKERIFHIRGFRLGGIMGLAPLQVQRDSLSLGIAMERFLSSFFKDGALLQGYFSTERKLNKEAKQDLEKDLRNAIGRGLENAMKVAVMQQGLEWKPIGVSPEAAQSIEGRKFQVLDVARTWHMPPHMVGDLERATFSNIEEQGIEYVVYGLGPDLTLWEESLLTQCFPPEQLTTHFPEFLVEQLLRGDTETRYKAYNQLWQMGAINADEIRERENMNPLPDGQGKIYFAPLNMVPLTDYVDGGSDSDSEPADNPQLESDAASLLNRNKPQMSLRQRQTRSVQQRGKIRAQWIPKLRAAFSKIIKREVSELRGAIEQHFNQRSTRDASSFLEFLRNFYESEDMTEETARAIRPVVQAYGEAIARAAEDEIGAKVDPELMDQFREDIVRSLTAEHLAKSAGQLEKLLRELGAEGIASEELEKRLEAWTETRAKKVSEGKAVQVDGRVARKVYELAGLQRIMWIAVGRNCPACNRLNGKIVGIRESFVAKGTKILEEGMSAPIWAGADILTAPLHTGCDCFVVAS